METSVALCEIRTQLQELTKSVESCQSEVSEVRSEDFCVKFLVFDCVILNLIKRLNEIWL